jgi:hypothetical protein
VAASVRAERSDEERSTWRESAWVASSHSLPTPTRLPLELRIAEREVACWLETMGLCASPTKVRMHASEVTTAPQLMGGMVVALHGIGQSVVCSIALAGQTCSAAAVSSVPCDLQQ